MNELKTKLAILHEIIRELETYHPLAVVLFGSLARHLHAAGLTVHAMLLADYGHGVTDRPEARWRASLQQVRLGHRLLQETCGEVHAVGMGFGAALALHLAERERVASLVLLAPALIPLVSLKVRLLRALGLLHFPPIRRRLGLVDDAPVFEIVVRRSFADYLCRWLDHVARHGGVAFQS